MSEISRQIAGLTLEQRIRLERRLRERSKASADGIPAARDRTQAPLSFAQTRLWFLDQLNPNSPLYNLSAAYEIVGELPVESLERAFGEVVRRHEVLRTTFDEISGVPVQVIQPPGEHFPTATLDLRDLEPD